MPLFTFIDSRLGPQQEGHVPAERINYHVLAKGGWFFRPGDWRQLDPKTGKTVRFVLDAEWRRRYQPASPGAQVVLDQELVPVLAREELPASVAAELAAEGHRVLKKVHLS